MSTVTLRALDRYRYLLVGWMLAVVLATLAFFSYQTSTVFINVLRPDFEAKAILVSDTIVGQFQRAADNKIEIKDLRGLPAFLDDAINDHPEVAYALVSLPESGKLYASTKFDKDARISPELRAHVLAKQGAARSSSFRNIVDVTTPLPNLGGTVLLHVGVDERNIQTRLMEIKFDLFITLFVSVVIALEVLFFVVLLTLDRQSQDIRGFVESVRAGIFPLVTPETRKGFVSPLTRALQNAIFAVNNRYRMLLQKGAATFSARSREGCFVECSQTSMRNFSFPRSASRWRLIRPSSRRSACRCSSSSFRPICHVHSGQFLSAPFRRQQQGWIRAF